MENILKTIPINWITAVLMILVSLWLIALIIRKERAFITRAVLLLLFFLSIHLYLNFSDPSTITIFDVKDALFPPKPLILDYQVSTRHTFEATFTRYVFKEPLPRLSLKMDESTKYFHIEDIRPINRILRQMGLPEVKQGAPELVSLTGQRFHISQYRWEKYPLGIMTMEKTLCQDTDALETYHCLISIRIRSRY